MVTAIICLNVELPHLRKVAEELAALPAVAAVYSVAGKYDLVALVRVNANEDLADLVTDRMVKLPGITQTETLIAFRSYSRKELEAGFSLGPQ